LVKRLFFYLTHPDFICLVIQEGFSFRESRILTYFKKDTETNLSIPMNIIPHLVK